MENKILDEVKEMAKTFDVPRNIVSSSGQELFAYYEAAVAQFKKVIRDNVNEFNFDQIRAVLKLADAYFSPRAVVDCSAHFAFGEYFVLQSFAFSIVKDGLKDL